MFLLSTVCLLAIFGGSLVYELDPGFHESLPGAIWWAFLRLTDTGYMGEDQGMLRRVVSATLTFSGHIIFVGAVIAILTNGFSGGLRWLASGRGPVLSEGHVVVLGSPPALENLLPELLYLESKNPAGRADIVVLAPDLQHQTLARITRSVPRSLRRAARVLFRLGDTYEASVFEVANWSLARCLIVVSRAEPAHQAALFKLLLELSLMRPPAPPRLVLEVPDEASRQRFARLNWPAEFDILPRSHFAGQLLAQVVANPGLAALYDQLLTDRVGHALYLLRPVPPGYVGLTLAEAVRRSGHGLPIGVLRNRTTLIALMETTIEAQDGLIIVSDRPECLPGKSRSVVAAAVPDPLPVPLEGELAVVGEGPWSGAFATEWERAGGARPRLLEEAESAAVLVLLADYGSSLDPDASSIATLHGLPSGPRVVCEIVREENERLVHALAPDAEVVAIDRILNHIVAQVAAKPALYEVYADLLAQGGSHFRSLRLQSELSFEQAQAWALSRGCLALGFYDPARRLVELTPAAETRCEGFLLILQPEAAADSPPLAR